VERSRPLEKGFRPEHRATDYIPLRAFSQGGFYWDKDSQQIIRDGGLAEFLPAVEIEEDERGKHGLFHREEKGREILSHSRPLGRLRVPPDQLRTLGQAVDEFKRKAQAQDTQPQSRVLIERFQLPDVAHDPDLYRLTGPWWNRRLQILWGCERRYGSSCPAAEAVAKLEPDTAYHLKRALGLFALLLLHFLAARLWSCS
jgi:hypothetical protein